MIGEHVVVHQIQFQNMWKRGPLSLPLSNMFDIMGFVNILWIPRESSPHTKFLKANYSGLHILGYWRQTTLESTF